MPYPLHQDFREEMRSHYDRVLVLEETYPVIELQLADGRSRAGRSKAVPREGELTPDVIRPILAKFLGLPMLHRPRPPAGRAAPALPCAPAAATGPPFTPSGRPFPEGIFPSDIGCYTLGMNLGAVDTCHCMGAGISQAAGFYHALRRRGGRVPHRRGHHRRLHLFPRRHPGPHQRGLPRGPASSWSSWTTPPPP